MPATSVPPKYGWRQLAKMWGIDKQGGGRPEGAGGSGGIPSVDAGLPIYRPNTDPKYKPLRRPRKEKQIIMAKKKIDIDALVEEIGKRDNTTVLTKRALEYAVVTKAEQRAARKGTNAALEESRIWHKIYTTPDFNPGLEWMKENVVSSFPVEKVEKADSSAAQAKLEKIAKGLRSADPRLSYKEAMDRACVDNPELERALAEEIAKCTLDRPENKRGTRKDDPGTRKRTGRPLVDDLDEEADDRDELDDAEEDDDEDDDDDGMTEDDDDGGRRIREKERKGMRLANKVDRIAKKFGRTVARAEPVTKAVLTNCSRCAAEVIKSLQGVRQKFCSYCGNKL
jgi:hypothetical protein